MTTKDLLPGDIISLSYKKRNNAKKAPAPSVRSPALPAVPTAGAAGASAVATAAAGKCMRCVCVAPKIFARMPINVYTN